MILELLLLLGGMGDVEVKVFSTTPCPFCVEYKSDLVRNMARDDLKKFTFINDDDLSKKFKVDAWPTTIIFSKGKEVWRAKGRQRIPALLEKIKSYE